MPGESARTPQRRMCRRLFSYAKPHGRGWVVIGAATLLSASVALAQPWPVQVLIDHVVGGRPLSGPVAWLANHLAWTDTTRGLLGWTVAAGLFIFFLNSVADIGLTMAWTRVGRRMVYALAGD